jgi:hypothetical protein
MSPYFVPVSVPAPIAGAELPRPDLRERWPARLVATAEEGRLSLAYLDSSVLRRRQQRLL